MRRIILALILALILAAPAAADDIDIYSTLTAQEWVTRDVDGTVNYVTFRGLDPEDKIGLAVREFTVGSEAGGVTLRSIPMMFHVSNGLVVISGTNYFVMGSGGWLWRVDRDTQTVEPVPD